MASKKKTPAAPQTTKASVKDLAPKKAPKGGADLVSGALRPRKPLSALDLNDLY
jgi:hypothetical protein